MPGQIGLIYDTLEDKYCSHYSINFNFCTWGTVETAQAFTSKQDADNAIAAWPDGDQNGRFIGKNPPPH